jgi:hypothetical protein
MPRTLRAVLFPVLVVLPWLSPEPALAQWFVGLEIGSERYWGGTIETTPDERSFRPYRPTVLVAVLERRSGSVGAALRLKYADASLALEGSDAVVAVKDVFTVVSAAPEISYRLLTLGLENELRLHAGTLFEYWSVEEEDSRIRVGAHGAVSLTLPVGGGFALSLAAYGAVIGSPFEETELLETYERRALWRRGVSGGLRYRL